MKVLLQETIECLINNGKDLTEVKWVGSKDGIRAITWAEFADIAVFEYDSGFGGQKIASDLVIVGDNWWLERNEYDGSEWWEFKALPIKMDNSTTFDRLAARNYWETLQQINSLEEEA